MELSRILHHVHAPPQPLRPNINTLAIEILAIIFGFCVDSPVWERRREQAPMILTRVCSLWRRVALSTPSLWAELNFFITESPSIHLAERIQDVWLSRLGTAGPLHLHIKIAQVGPDEHDRERLGRFLNDFLCRYHPYIPRLRSLTLDRVFLRHAQDQVSFTSLPVSQFPNLHQIKSIRITDAPVFDWVFSLLPFALDVESLTWIDRGVEDVIRTIPLTHLQTLEFECTYAGYPLSLADLQKLLPEAPQLLELALTFENDPSLSPPTSYLSHNHIRVLKVGIGNNDMGESVAPNTFNYITLPALTELDINASSLLSDWEATPIVNFLKRSRCNLTFLYLDPPPRMEDIKECLEIPSLEKHLSDLHIANTNWCEQEDWGSEDADDPKVPVIGPVLEYLSTMRYIGNSTRLPLLSLDDISVWIDPFENLEALIAFVDQRLPAVAADNVPPNRNGVSYITRMTVVAVVEENDYPTWSQDTGFRDKYIEWQRKEFGPFVDVLVCRPVEGRWKFEMREAPELPSPSAGSFSMPEDDDDDDDGGRDDDYDSETSGGRYANTDVSGEDAEVE
ncbi:hypothetical protein PM082_021013 [Marasmius tenuissimus]|nr:hypothetical protein PM082_021013 [Marasmius tenuissimus]